MISDSGACVIVCEDDEQLAKIDAIRDRVPDLRAIIMIEAAADGAASANGSAEGASAIEMVDARAASRARARSPR